MYFWNAQIPLDAIVNCLGGVEVWIGNLLVEMQSTVQMILAQMAMAQLEPEFNFIVDFQEYCGQVTYSERLKITIVKCAYRISVYRVVWSVSSSSGLVKQNLLCANVERTSLL